MWMTFHSQKTKSVSKRVNCPELTKAKSRLLKPGMDGHYAVILDLIWESATADQTPRIFAEIIPVADYEQDSELMYDVNKAYSVLEPLMKTDLTIIPKKYRPLSSRGVREKRTTMV